MTILLNSLRWQTCEQTKDLVPKIHVPSTNFCGATYLSWWKLKCLWMYCRVTPDWNSQVEERCKNLSQNRLHRCHCNCWCSVRQCLETMYKCQLKCCSHDTIAIVIFYRNKWVVWDSMEVFTWCDFHNETKSHRANNFVSNKSQSQSYRVNIPVRLH